MNPHLNDLDLLRAVDGAGAPLADEIRRHLAECAECAAALRAMQSAAEAMRVESVRDVVPDLTRAVAAGIARRQPSRVASAWSLRRRDAAMFAAGLVIATGATLWLRPPTAPVVAERAGTTPPPGTTGYGRYLLALDGGEPDSKNTPRDSLNQRFRAYGSWAQAMSKEHLLIQAAKLGEDAGRYVVSADSAVGDSASRPGVRLAGYFVIWAASYEEAVSWARRSPHLTYGGHVIVRRIE